MPLMGEIRDDLDLTDKDVWNSTIASVGGTILMRILLGSLCDKDPCVTSLVLEFSS